MKRSLIKDVNIEIGNRIRNLREGYKNDSEKPMTQDQLADKMSLWLKENKQVDDLAINKQKISRYENGMTAVQPVHLIALSKIFCVSTDYLLGITELKNYSDGHKIFTLNTKLENYINEFFKALKHTMLTQDKKFTELINKYNCHNI